MDFSFPVCVLSLFPIPREIVLSVLVVGGIALILGVILGIVSKLFQTRKNKLLSDLTETLPGVNCGACGFSSCEGYAKWLAEGGRDTGKCPVGGNEVSDELAGILNIPARSVEALVAHVMCKGTTHNTSKRYEYRGSLGCTAAHSLFSGPNSCTYGCMGYGDCVEVCPYGAIDIVDGIAVINDFKCKACELCVAVCPKKLIFMVPKHNNNFKVECRNKWPGAQTRKHCSVGCIGCQRCVKVCPSNAITMDGPLAVIDPYLCISCGKCYEVCPTKSISSPAEHYHPIT
jgi:Na+-translocating ferredoxin:NAD+ oxidoreductase subunit B